MFQHHIKLWILRRFLSIDLLINYVIVIHPPVASNVGMENQPRHSLLWLPLGSPPCVCRLPKSHHYAIIEGKAKWLVIRDVAALYHGGTITILNLRYTLPHWVRHEGVSTVLLRGLFCFNEFIPKMIVLFYIIMYDCIWLYYRQSGGEIILDMLQIPTYHW